MIKFPGKIPITIHPLFWLIVIFISWINAFNLTQIVIWTIVIVVSVVIHEFGHALTAVAFGQTAKIDLVAFGGVTQRYGGKKLKLWQEFVIVLNGPLAGLVLALCAWWIQRSLIISHPEAQLTYAVVITFYVNIFWTFMNLLPVQPLDGGKLLSIALEAIFGLRGKKIALFISLIFSSVVGIFMFSIHAFLAGSFFLLFAFESYRAWKASLSVTEQDQNFILQHQLKEAENDIARGHKDEALRKFQRLRDIAKQGLIYKTATEHAAHLFAEMGELKEAHDLLLSLGNKLSPEGIRLLHQLAYRNGNWQEAITLGKSAYHHYPDYHIAIINASSHALLGQVQPAVGWLHCAIKEGLPNLQEILAQKEFDPIRNDPMFLQLKKPNA